MSGQLTATRRRTSSEGERSRVPLSPAARRQGVALSGQLVAGVGNLLVSVALARLLVPGDYATFTAFLGGYVLLHMVAASVTAATALDPSLERRLTASALGLGLVGGGALAALSGQLGPLLGLPVPVVALLGASVPSAGLLALARGRLYGIERVGATAATLVAEPLVRAGVGLALVPVLGVVGAATAVVLAGYAALGVALVAGRRPPEPALRAGDARRPVLVTGAFLLVAVIAAQDVVVANRVLPGAEAGLVAVVATLGGAAYFATATVPMVLLPSGAADRGSLRTALLAAAGVSLAIVAAVALVPAQGYALVLGGDYHALSGDLVGLAVGYVAAMAALGVAKVLLARLCQTGRSPLAITLAVLSVLVQLALLLVADSAGDIVLATGAACGLLLLGAGLGVLTEEPDPLGAAAPPRSTTATLAPQVVEPEPVEPPRPTSDDLSRPRRLPGLLRDGWPLLLAVAVGLTLRLLVTRSIWLDEAISIRQAQLPFAEMIADLRENDVHPPGFGAVLWAVVQATGSTAEWVVRLPSLIAGTLLIPLYWVVARDLWDRRTAVVAAFVVAVAPVGVWYAQEARMYALWMLTATLALWMQARILRSAERGGRGTPASWTVFVLATVATGYLQWFAVLPVLVQHLVFAGAAMRRRTRRLWAPWLGSLVASLVLVAPLVPFALGQLGSVIDAGAGTTPGQTGADVSAVGSDAPDVYAVLANGIWAVWGYHADTMMVQISAFWPIVVLGSLALLGRGRSYQVLVLLAVALVPVAILFAVGFERRQLFELRYFTVAVPVLLLLLARVTASWARGPLTSLLLPVVVVGSLGVALVDQQVNQSNPRTYDFRGGVGWIQERAAEDDLLLYAPLFLDDELEYYNAGIRDRSSTDLDTERPGLGLGLGEPGTAQRAAAADRSIFVFASFLDEVGVSSEVGRTLSGLEDAGWQIAEEHEVANVHVWELRTDDAAPAPTSPTPEEAAR